MAAAIIAGLLFAPAASAAPGDFVISGRGNGHGQGLSQWGAWYGSHVEHATYQQILNFYYPGTQLSTLAAVAPTKNIVTIRITTDVDEFSYVQLKAAATSAKLVDSTGAVIDTLAVGEAVTLVNSGGKVQVSGSSATYSFVELKPDSAGGRVTVVPSKLWTSGGDRTYWGSIRILPSASSVYIHNIVPIEKYITGVAEMISDWAKPASTTWFAPDAMKAQCVAARSFVAAGGVSWDDTRGINYVGYDYEVGLPYLVQAAAETAGVVLTYGGKVVAGHFSAHSGGYTTNLAWTSTIPYEPAKPDPWSAAAPPSNPGYAWTVTLTPADITTRLALGIGTITKIEVIQRDTADATSHVRALRVTGTTGTKEITGTSFRSKLSLRSNLILSIVKEGVGLNVYQQNDPKLLYMGNWIGGTSSLASGGSYLYLNSTGSCTVTFDGTYLEWLGKKKSTYGKARLTLDGVGQGTLDLYNPTEVYTKVWQTPTLDPGTHTLKIEWTGEKNASATNTNVTVDAFRIDGTLLTTPKPPVVPALNQYDQDQKDSANNLYLLYAGNWTFQPAASATAGSFRYLNSTGSCTVTFNGTYLEWLGKKKSTYGKAKLTLDGVGQGTLDLYNPTEVYTKVWQTPTLAPGIHTLKIEWTGLRNASATNTNVAVDGFKVDGTLVVTPKPPPPPKRYEQSDGNIFYLGTWSAASAPAASGGSHRYSKGTISSPTSCTVSFDGTYLAWRGKKSPQYGLARVIVDGVDKGTVDLYNATELYTEVWNTGTLTSGRHTVTILWTGDKNPSAADTNVSVDAFDIRGTIAPAPPRLQHNAAGLKYTGTWQVFTTSAASGGSYYRSSTNGASVTITFEGTYLGWVATKGTTLTKALVSVDGGAARTVDLAASVVAYQRKVWNTGILKWGTHTVTITRAPAMPTGKFISLDAIDLVGVLK